MTNPYAAHAAAYRAAGWAGVLRLPHGQKTPPPQGYTGEGGKWPTNADVEAWAEQGGNIALRLPVDVVALDVDRLDAFLPLLKTLGPLPPTWRSVGAREPGHLYFRLPEGVTYRDLKAPCAGVDLLRHSHRYSLVWPSLHPDGMVYRWESPTGQIERLPTPSMLPVLPDAWVEALKGVPAPRQAEASGNVWDSFNGGAPGLGEPIHTNHDDALASFTASLCARGVRKEEALVLALARAGDCVGGDPRRPFGEADFERWWRGAEAKFTPVDNVAEVLAGTAEAVAPEGAEATPYQREVAKEATRLKVAQEARRLVAEADVSPLPASLRSLREELALPPEPIQWAIEGLLPAHGNAVLTAQFKAGKSTTMLNLVRSLVDGEPFLDRFEVPEPQGRVGLFNYEVGADQMRRWAREARIGNVDAVSLLHLRGHRLPLTADVVQDQIVAWLRDNGITTWIVDPLGPAMAGVDENSNTEVRLVLAALDEIKARAGVRELVVTAHTGRGNESQGRARGATVVDDWPDARWILTRPEELDGLRFFKAHGRDVDVEEEQMQFDETTRKLTFGGWDSKTLIGRKKGDAGADRVLSLVGANPGIGKTELIASLGMAKDVARRAVDDAVASGALRVVEIGPSKTLHLRHSA